MNQPNAVIHFCLTGEPFSTPDIPIEIDNPSWWEDGGGDSMRDILRELIDESPDLNEVELVTKACDLYFGAGNWRVLPVNEAK